MTPTSEQFLDGDQRTLVACLALTTNDAGWMARFLPAARRWDEGVRGPGDKETLGLMHSQLAARFAESDESVHDVEDDVLLDALDAVLGTRPSEEYLAIMRWRLGLETSVHPRRMQTDKHAVVVGAGMSGLRAAIELGRRGIECTIIERRAEPGGVWLDNVYPDCGVDTAIHLYDWSDFPNNWSRFDPKRDEMHSYISGVAQAELQREQFLFDTEVVEATWRPEDTCWELRCLSPEGPSTIRADFVIMAVGTLNQPKIPYFEGMETFEGVIMHTAQWRSEVELEGKRVGIVGNGSSGVQVLRPLVEIASDVTVFQRSSAWLVPRSPATMGEIPESIRALLDAVPHYRKLIRTRLFWQTDVMTHDYFQVDPTWSSSRFPTVNASSEQVAERLAEYISDEVGRDERLTKLLIPDYPPYTKRLVTDNYWYASLSAPNCHLVTSAIASVTAKGIRTADGELHPLDVLILATGFHGTRFFWPTTITGIDGQSIRDRGVDAARAYLGVGVPGFPNLFSVMGPNGAGHGGGATETAEQQIDFIGACIEMLIDAGAETIEVTQKAFEEYNTELDEALERTVWCLGGVTNRYRNSEGRIVTQHPWTSLDYWRRIRTPRRDHFHLV